MEYVICSKCGLTMEGLEMVDGEEVDWSLDTPVCPNCRGVPGAKPVVRKRDVLGGMPWKRDADGNKVPK